MSISDDDFQLQVPAWAEEYIALQRTQYQHPIGAIIRKLFRQFPYDRYMLRYVERLRNRRIGESYTRDILGEYRSIEPWLPATAVNILDIGCGMGGIDVCLFEHYGRTPMLYLMDKTKLDRVFYGYEAEAAFYNDFALTKSFLHLNGVPETHIRFLDAAAGNIDGAKAKFDLVVSLIAWGFHFPLATYLDEVLRSMRPNGRIIVDLRKGSDGIETLEARKLKVELIHEHGKYHRTCITA